MDENKNVHEVERKAEKNGTHWNEEHKKINLMSCHIHACSWKVPCHIPVGFKRFLSPKRTDRLSCPQSAIQLGKS
jgi:hypothetical protein